MDLTHVIAERENKKIYRDGGKAIKVFAEGYSKADILNEAPRGSLSSTPCP